MGSFYGLQAASSAAEFQHALALQAIAEFLRQLSMALMPSIRRVNVLHERRVNFVKILVKPTVHGPHTSSCWQATSGSQDTSSVWNSKKDNEFDDKCKSFLWSPESGGIAKAFETFKPFSLRTSQTCYSGKFPAYFSQKLVVNAWDPLNFKV